MGQVVPSSCVDHRDGDPNNDDASNLRALCTPCHSRKTAHQDGGFGNAKSTPRPATGVDGWPVGTSLRSSESYAASAVLTNRRGSDDTSPEPGAHPPGGGSV